MKVGLELHPENELEVEVVLGRMKSGICKPCQECTFLCVEKKSGEIISN